MPDIFISPQKLAPKTNTSSASSPAPTQSTRAKLLSSYSFMPEDMHFETQEPGETILLLLRKHFITNLPWLLMGAILILFPVIIFPIISFSSLLPTFVPPNFITFIILLWYLLTFSFILAQFLLWYFNVWIVTSERVVDIDFSSLLYKSISETRIAKIEDVTEKTGGFIRALFNFGDVFIQTAGTAENFIFYAVPRPGQVVQIINQLMGKEEEQKGS